MVLPIYRYHEPSTFSRLIGINSKRNYNNNVINAMFLEKNDLNN